MAPDTERDIEHCLMHEPSCVRVQGRWKRVCPKCRQVLLDEQREEGHIAACEQKEDR